MVDDRRSNSVQPGDKAPEFVLPAVNREGDVALEDYRDKTSVLVALYRGLHCPFCRRHLASLNIANEKLKAVGVETLAVVNTPLERARLYFRYHPTPVVLAADPERIAHQAFGVPNLEVTADETDWPRKVAVSELSAVRVNPTGELAEPVPVLEVNDALNAKDGFQLTDTDEQIRTAAPAQLVGQFLVDRGGVVRWTFIEAEKGLADVSKFPTADDFVAAAAAITTSK